MQRLGSIWLQFLEIPFRRNVNEGSSRELKAEGRSTPYTEQTLRVKPQTKSTGHGDAYLFIQTLLRMLWTITSLRQSRIRATGYGLTSAFGRQGSSREVSGFGSRTSVHLQNPSRLPPLALRFTSSCHVLTRKVRNAAPIERLTLRSTAETGILLSAHQGLAVFEVVTRPGPHPCFERQQNQLLLCRTLTDHALLSLLAQPLLTFVATRNTAVD
jgi:hypothetical protein